MEFPDLGEHCSLKECRQLGKKTNQLYNLYNNFSLTFLRSVPDQISCPSSAPPASRFSAVITFALKPTTVRWRVKRSRRVPPPRRTQSVRCATDRCPSRRANRPTTKSANTSTRTAPPRSGRRCSRTAVRWAAASGASWCPSPVSPAAWTTVSVTAIPRTISARDRRRRIEPTPPPPPRRLSRRSPKAWTAAVSCWTASRSEVPPPMGTFAAPSPALSPTVAVAFNSLDYSADRRQVRRRPPLQPRPQPELLPLYNSSQTVQRLRQVLLFPPTSTHCRATWARRRR